MSHKTILSSIGILLLASIAYYFLFLHVSKPRTVPDDLPKYAAAALARYNGENGNLPIYIALDGYVYDVTAGKSFYVPGGTYHSIAGKDASRELHMFGGDVIKQKYPIVCMFVKPP
mgnify:CR=1 FL=1